MVKAVLFDLDGTLLPMNEEYFTKKYFERLCAKMTKHGYDPDMLIKAVWAGTEAMIKNRSDDMNDTVFWRRFSGIMGEKTLADRPLFDEFYANEFEKIQQDCGFDPKAAGAVAAIKNAGFRTAVATNPIFPLSAMESRVRWAGLSPSDFEFITAYENINRCKPDPRYYSIIAARMGLDPSECLMAGNNVAEDMVAGSIGMETFLFTGCLINREEKDISGYARGDFDGLLELLGIR